MTRATGRFFTIMTFFAIGVGGSATDAQQPPLDQKAREAIASFSDGVIVQTESQDLLQPGVEDAVSFAGLTPGTSMWKVTAGDKKGKTLKRTVQPHPSSDAKHIIITEGSHTSMFEIDKGSIFRTAQISVGHGTLTTFKPFEPVLINKLGPGTPMTRNLAISVHAIDDPSVVTHTGTLKAVYQVLGTFDVHVPAGDFKAIGIRVTYNGSVGPASIKDEAYFFFSKGVGPVAIRGRSHISAFLIYNQTKNFSMVLESLPKLTEAAESVGTTD